MLGELSGSLAHELNQPLSAILSNAQAALNLLALDPIDLHEVRDIIADNCGRRHTRSRGYQPTAPACSKRAKRSTSCLK